MPESHPSNEPQKGFWGKLKDLSGPLDVLSTIVGLVASLTPIAIAIYNSKSWKVIPVYGLIGIALAVISVSIIVLSNRLWKRRTGEKRRLNEALDAEFTEDYHRGDLSFLLTGQYACRSILVAYACFSEIPRGFSEGRLTSENIFHRAVILLIAAYFGFSTYFFVKGKSQNRRWVASGSSGLGLSRGILWAPAVADFLIVTVLSILSASAMYGLGYIIPVLGAWLFSQPGRGILLFAMILAGVFLKYALLCMISEGWPEKLAYFGLSSTPSPMKFVISMWLPQTLFWAAAGLPLLILKKLRAMETRKRKEAEENSQMLDTIANHIVYAVFRKNKDRAFEFVNSAFLQRLNRTRDEVIGKTDEAIGIYKPAYEESDRKVLDNPSPNFIFQELEPNFEIGPDSHEMVYTTKKAILGRDGKPTGLVGLCEPGTPMQLLKHYDRLPYFVTFKDPGLHIQWANAKFLNDDVDRSLKWIREQNEKKGATDIDLYGEKLGEKYRTADLKLISQVQDAIDKRRDLASIAQLGVDELHYFPKTGLRRWVRVTKLPCVDPEKKKILGVYVYFHDVHESVCMEGMIGRWLGIHAPRLFHGWVRSVAGAEKGTALKVAGRVSAEMRLGLLTIQTIGWIKSVIMNEPLMLNPSKESVGISEVEWLKGPLQEAFRGIHLSFAFDPIKISGDLQIIECIILIFVMNAYEATDVFNFPVKVRKALKPDGSVEDDTRPKVHVRISTEDKIISISVTDEGHGFLPEDEEEIVNGERTSEDEKPGSGLFFLKHLATSLEAKLTVKSPGKGDGATACFQFKKDIFETVTLKKSIPAARYVKKPSVDRQRNLDAFMLSAKEETKTKGFHEWAGAERVTLAIAFTDVFASTALGVEFMDAGMNEVRRAHFLQSRTLINHFKGREIKTIGDSFMAVFKSADQALDFALALQKDTGHAKVRIRAGIHIGPMSVEEGDVFGGTVNFAAGVVEAIGEKLQIWVSDQAKGDIDQFGRHKLLKWERHEGQEMKGLAGRFTLWSVAASDLKTNP